MINSKVNNNSEEDEKIDIVSIVEDFLYSMKYGNQECEYDRIFNQLENVDSITHFFEENKDYLNLPAWNKVTNIESATRQVLKEAYELEKRLFDFAENAMKGKTPDLDKMFQYIGGKEFSDIYEYTPMKAYGKGRPPFLRLYAIKLAPNKYVITGGRIKLHDSIQSSPGIKEHVLQNIRRTREWLQNV